jgi:hypothetical protein
VRRKILSLHLFALLPLIGIAAMLYYGLDNPGLGRQGASTSWFLLFLARHVVLYCLSRATQAFLIDFLSLRTFSTVRVLGPFWSLCLVQSKGFPFTMSVWSLYGFMMLSGSNRYVLALVWIRISPWFELLLTRPPSSLWL